MIESILNILGAGLSLWESKERRKYLDEYLKLQDAYYEEISKDNPDHAELDNIEFRLVLLGNAFSAKVEGSKAADL